MSFQRKTTLAIVLIALFVIGNQVFIGCWLIQKKYDAKVINVSGKQRMLSQRIMALTFDYQIHKNRAEVTEAQALFEEWKIAHYSLMNGDKAGEIKGTSLVIKQSLKQLTAQIIFTESIIKKIDDLRPNELLKFNESQTQFLVKMDKTDLASSCRWQNVHSASNSSSPLKCSRIDDILSACLLPLRPKTVSLRVVLLEKATSTGFSLMSLTLSS
jgi:nitrate/nitrite-specific signal transduction histidine kinase